MKILYVTTFNKKIWEASAVKMLNSFLEHKIEGDMLICYEGFKYDPTDSSYIKSKSLRELAKDRFLIYDLTSSKFLNSWLKENADVIPPEMGGTANKDKTPGAFLPWNFRAAGWFRKIASLEYALTTYAGKYDAIVFVDADCELKKHISASLVEKAFGKDEMFYHWGKERPKKGLGVESGFVGFRGEHGFNVLSTWINKYKNKVFRRYMMWDDGGMLSNVLYECNFSHTKDLVEDYAENGKSQSHVLERGMFAEYIVHNKGVHKKLGITNV
jgi:hypothetical protein